MPQYDSSSYLIFVQKIKQIITTPKDRQKQQQQLASYPIDFMLDLIYDQSQPIDIRKMSCIVLKLKMSNKQLCIKQNIDPQQVLGRLQIPYMINSANNKQLTKLQNTIQLVLQKIFQTHFDDNKKIQIFQQICEKLISEPFCKQYKHLCFLEMLIRSMYYLSINNQVIIGQMVVYLAETVENWEWHRLSYSQGSEIDIQLIQKEIIQISIKCIHIMSQIKQIIEVNNEEQESVVQEYMQNSKQLKANLLRILKMQTSQIRVEGQQKNSQIKRPVNTIWVINDQRFNKLKSVALTLWSQVWVYYAQPQLIQLIFASVLTITKYQIIDQIQNIITLCLVILQRSCTHKQYNDLFFKMTQNLSFKLFQLISINQSQFSLIEKDPDYFIQINDDFCKQQQEQTMKTRAGSLLSNLTLAIDGYLSFVTQLALLALRQLQIHQQKNQNEMKIWTSFLSVWPCTQQQLIQASILIISSISDQISKRKDLMPLVQHHLKIMIKYFSPQQPLSKKPLLVLRYLQMYSFFSFPGCLDHFIKYYNKQVVYQKQLSKSFQILMRYYDRKDKKMQDYVRQTANSIMLLGQFLTPLLQQQIMNNNRVIKNFKQNVLQKLIIWFLNAYNKQQVLKVNKKSTLIIRLLHDNMKSQIKQQTNLYPFSSQLLNTYLDQIYKQLQKRIQHPCQQAIIEIAISHVTYLYDLEQIDYSITQKFFLMAQVVTQRNKYCLNNCLILFNSLICPDIAMFTKRNQLLFKYNKLTLKISISILKMISNWFNLWKPVSYEQLTQTIRQQDLWQIFQLVQIALFQIQYSQNNLIERTQNQIQEYKNSSNRILQFCLKIADYCQSTTFRMKVISVLLQIVQTFPEDIKNYSFLENLNFPNACDFPAYQCRKYNYCLSKIMKNYQGHFTTDLRIKILKVIIDVIYFLQNQKINMKNYDNKIYVNGDVVALNASQKINKIYSSFDFRLPFDVHDQFRKIIHEYPKKEQLSLLNSQQSYQGKIRDLVDKIIVNEKPRKKITVKRYV